MKLELPLIGGVGNQLFVLAYGLYRKHFEDIEVNFQIPVEDSGNGNHGCLISDEMHVFKELPVSIQSKYEAIITKAQRFASRLGFGTCVLRFTGVIHSHEGIALDKKFQQFLTRKDVNVRESGYFQESKYLLWLQENGYPLNLLPMQPSIWLNKQLESLDFENSIAIHIRRTDFKNKGGPGSLSINYYLEGIRQLNQISAISRVVVFSDDIEGVELELEQCNLQEEIIYIQTPMESSDFESLYLLSRFKNVVIANSTFSWWAAATGPGQKNVVFPSVWTKEGTPNFNLPLTTWKAVSPEWDVT